MYPDTRPGKAYDSTQFAVQVQWPGEAGFRVGGEFCRALKILDELFNFQLGVAEDSAESARGKFLVQGNCDWRASRICGVPQANIAALSTNGNVAKLAKDADYFVARDDGQLGAHRETRTLPTRTSLGSGMGSPRLSISSRTSSMASRILATASTKRLPSDWHHG